MAKITIKYDPQGITRPDKIIFLSGKSAIDVILDELPIPFQYISVLLNGEKIKLPTLSDDGEIIDTGDEVKLTKPLIESDTLKAMCVQQGGGGVLDVVAPVFSLSTSAATSAASKALEWVYKVPSYSSSSSSSDSGADSGTSKTTLEGQTNTTNLYNAIPDRYGASVIYPDLIDNEAYSVYTENNQTITQFMCLGVGEYDWNDLYLGNTQVGLVPGATVTRFEPVDGVTTIDDYFFSRSVSQVSRSDLDGPGANKVSLATNNTGIFFTYDSENNIGRIDVGGFNVSPAFSNYFSVGDTVTLTGADEIIGDDGFGGVDYYTLSGTYTVNNVDSRYIEFSNATSVDSDWQYMDPDFGTGETSYQDGSTETNITMQSTSSSLTYQGPFYTSSAGRGFLLDFGFYSGLKGSVTVNIEYTVYDEIDGTEIDSGTDSVTYSASTFDQKNYTYKFDYSEVDENDYYFGVRVARTTDESSDAANPDTIKWDRFASFAQFTTKEFGYNVSMIKVEIPYSSSAISPSSNKVNITGTRKTITYNSETGEVIDTISPTTDFADALLHMYVVTHSKSASDLDLDSLYEISERIGSPLNQFSYSFDNTSQSLEDKMTIICNAARVSFFWDGQMYRFSRDESKAGQIPAIISRTDIAHPDDRQYTRSFNPNLPTAYDSIKLEYIYPDRNNEAAYIRLTYDESGNIITGLGVNPKSITLSGCRNKGQAINRAQLEIRKLLYQRWSVQDTLMKNGYLFDSGDYVQYQDVFRSDVYSGEILNISGATLYLSSLVTLESGVSYEIWYNDQYADTHGPYALADGDGSEAKEVVISDESYLSDAYTRGGEMGLEIQVGSRFTINKVSTGPIETFTITTKEGVDNQHVNIVMAQYDERVYEFDSE